MAEFILSLITAVLAIGIPIAVIYFLVKHLITYAIDYYFEKKHIYDKNHQQ